MAILQTVNLPEASIHMRWKEEYVTEGLNRKSLATQAKGIVAGFNVVATAGYVLNINPDPILGLSIANVLDTSSSAYIVSVVINSVVPLDLTLLANKTIYIVLDAQFSVGTHSAAQIKVVEAADLIDPDLLLLARIIVPAVAPTSLTSAINAAYRTVSGDNLPYETQPPINLASNPSFEKDVIWLPGSLTSAGRSTLYARTGAASLKLRSSGVSNGVSYSPHWPVMPGETYRVRAWIRSESGGNVLSGSAQIQVQWSALSQANGGPVAISSSSVDTAYVPTSPNTWVLKQALVTAPSTAEWIQLGVRYVASSGDVYIDDIEIVTRNPSQLFSNPTLAGSDGSVKNRADLLHSHDPNYLLWSGTWTWADGTQITSPTTNTIPDLIYMVGPGTLATSLGSAKIGHLPAGNIAATRVDTAINELDAEKAGIALANTFTKTQTINPSVANSDGLISSANGSGRGGVFAATTGVAVQGTSSTNSGIAGTSTSGAGAAGTSTAGPGVLGASSTDASFKASGSTSVALDAQSKLVSNLALALTDNDAVTKLYLQHVLQARQNLLINGDMNHWSRSGDHLYSWAPTDPYIDSTAWGMFDSSVIRYLADRWFLTASTNFSRTYSLIGANSSVGKSAQVGFATGIASGNYLCFGQEIDRNLLRSWWSRNPVGSTSATKVRIRFKAKIGGSANGTFTVNFATGTNSGLSGPSGIEQVHSATAMPRIGTTSYTLESSISTTFTPSTGWATYDLTIGSMSGLNANSRFNVACLWFKYENLHTATGADTLAVTDVHLWFEDEVTPMPYVEPRFTLAGWTDEGEKALLRRYYETSYDQDHYPTVGGNSRTASGLIAGNRALPYVHYRTEKHLTDPSAAVGTDFAVGIYSHAGTSGFVTVIVGATTAAATPAYASGNGFAVDATLADGTGVEYNWISDYEFAIGSAI